MKPCSGNVFQIQRWSIHDGEGIRSTVFFKGCPLRCSWCANPESWSNSCEIFFLRERCVVCGRCVQACNAGATAMDNEAVSFKRTKCSGCGACCVACPTGARKKIGSTMTVEEIMQIIRRDIIFYRESGGGVTFSGGEPFAQPEFLRQLVAACGRIGIHTAVETSGYFDWDQVKDIIALLDCIFIDIKHMDDQLHQKWTGVSNQQILKNIRLLSPAHLKPIIRVPLIEEVNANERNIRQMCEFLQQNASLEGIELLPYHDLGGIKHTAIGAACPSFTTPSAEKIEALKTIIASYGLPNIEFK